MTKEERLEKQRQRFMELKSYEEALHRSGYRYIAGVDEVGRGPLAGPVVAAAVILPEDFDVPGIDDSKKLSEKKREELFALIKEQAVAYGIGMADEKTIDEINILQATKLAMRQAIEEAGQRLKEFVQAGLPDAQGTGQTEQEFFENTSGDSPQIDYILFDAMKMEELDIPQESIIKGDSKVLAIAAASIIAKVTRDRLMVEYAKQYPGYSFEKNKGYGTREHYEGLAANGVCPIHRQSFLKKWREKQLSVLE